MYSTETGAEALASHARQMRAYQVLRKGELKGQRLAQIIGQALSWSQGSASHTVCDKGPLGSPPAIDGYKIPSQIGEGAIPSVFLAERRLDRLTVVLNIIELALVKHHAFVKRFVEEAELISELRSPHVVRIHEQGFTDEVGFIAIGFFPWGDLKHCIDSGISPADAVSCWRT